LVVHDFEQGEDAMKVIGQLQFLLLIGGFWFGTARAQEPVVLFDFTQGLQGWVAAHAVANMRVTAEGVEFDCLDEDPYIHSGPVANLPRGHRVLLTLRMKSDADPVGEVFFGRGFTAQDSVRFTVNDDGQWHEYELLLPAQEAGARLRIDPAAGAGHVTIAWIKAVELKPLSGAELAPPTAIELGEQPCTITAGDLVLAHGGKQWDGFRVLVAGEELAQSHGRSQLGVILNGEPAYLDLAGADCEVSAEPDGTLRVAARLRDAGGANWQFCRQFVPRGDGAIVMETAVTVDQPRQVFHLPMLTLFPGLGTFGQAKTQAVLPGVEYLENEPSSSEADVRGEQAKRRIVAGHKLCFPLMSVVANGRYVGLIWDRSDHPAAVFDSPDRIFHSDSHLLGLWFPGVGERRLENEAAAFRPFPIEANAAKTFTATLIGGRGQTVNSAVEQYVKLSGGLPPIPEYEGGFDGAVKLLAHGWLDSKLHEDGIWRHAVWGSRFPARPAADAPGYMLWLAEHTDDEALGQRLRAAAERGLQRLTPAGNWDARCSHVARPFAPLLFGQIEPYAARRLADARQTLATFDKQGLIRYRPQQGRPDYGSTHWEDHANGLSIGRLEPVLETAVFTGDEQLTKAALAILDKQLEVYRHTVPRGAQTWEMPLHTPDILASGRIVAGCNLAYQLTADQKYLDAAREWAWSGVSLVYLDQPVDGPVGLYATTAVLGATNWTAPFWIGLPVQWCGLVYRSSLQDLARLDPESGFLWEQLAAGITRSGLQQTFPLEDAERQGLLPDFFHLRAQRSDGPAISPGTVQANLAEAYGKTPIYALQRLTPRNVLLHVPGGIGLVEHCGRETRVPINGWYSKPYWVRLVRVPAPPPQVELQGGKVLTTEYNATRRTLNVLVEGQGTLVLKQLSSEPEQAEIGER
jgi:hypothetical protein